MSKVILTSSEVVGFVNFGAGNVKFIILPPTVHTTCLPYTSSLSPSAKSIISRLSPLAYLSIALLTYSVVATCRELFDTDGVGAVGVPVKLGELILA